MLNKEIVDVNGFSGMPILKMKIIRSYVSKIDKAYNEVANIFNDVVKKKELADENKLNICIKKFGYEVIDMLYEDMFEINAELDIWTIHNYLYIKPRQALGKPLPWQ